MRYFITILGIIFLVVVIIVLIAKGGSHKAPVHYPNVNNYSNSTSSVSQIVNGTLNGEDQRQAIEITINQSSRNIYILNGYEQNISNSETFPNTPAAYNVFLQGIQNAGFTIKQASNQDQNQLFAYCPLGDTFQYILNSSSKTVSSLWSTSCRRSDGNFNGNGQLIRSLFQLQIPNFVPFTENLPGIPNFYTSIL